MTRSFYLIIGVATQKARSHEQLVVRLLGDTLSPKQLDASFLVAFKKRCVQLVERHYVVRSIGQLIARVNGPSGGKHVGEDANNFFVVDYICIFVYSIQANARGTDADRVTAAAVTLVVSPVSRLRPPVRAVVMTSPNVSDSYSSPATWRKMPQSATSR